MKGKYKAALALLLLLILIPLTLLMTLGLWVPTLAGIWLPVGTRIALEQSPRLTRHGLVIPDLRYLVNDCSLAHITQAELTHPSRWLLNIKSLKLDAACLAKLPATEASPPRRVRWRSGSQCCPIPGLTSIMSFSRPGRNGRASWRSP